MKDVVCGLFLAIGAFLIIGVAGGYSYGTASVKEFALYCVVGLLFALVGAVGLGEQREV